MKPRMLLALLLMGALSVTSCNGNDSGPNASASKVADIQREAQSHPEALPPENLPSNFEEAVPGTAERKCVEVNQLLEETGRDGAIRSGEQVAGTFPHFIRSWTPHNENKLWFAPLHTQRMPGLKIRAIPLADPDKARLILYEDVAWGAEDAPPDSREAIETRFYPGSLRLPEAGKWRLVAVSGPDWGCFELTLPDE